MIAEYEDRTFEFTADTILVEQILVMKHSTRGDIIGVSFNEEKDVFVLTIKASEALRKALLAYETDMKPEEATAFINQSRQI